MFIENNMKILNILLILCISLFFNHKSYSNIEVEANYVILQDHLSGKILYEKDADAQIYPASLTKIMTTIVAFD